VAIVVLFSILAMSFGRARHSDPIRDHSVLRTNAWGLKALAELCRRHDLPVDVWDEPLDKLKPRQRFLCLFDPSVAPSDEDLQALVAWVKQGGHLLLAVDLQQKHNLLFQSTDINPDAEVLKAFGLTGRIAAPENSMALPVVEASELREVGQVLVPGPSRLVVASARETRTSLVRPQWRTLLADRFGAVMMAATVGAGTVYALCEVEVLSNKYLAQADNVVLATNLLFTPDHDRIYFEERLHFQTRPLSLEAGKLPLERLKLALWAALAAVALYLVGVGWRFGAPAPVYEKPRRSAMEFVAALADLYRKAGATGAIWQILRKSFRQRLAAAAGLPQELPAEQLAEALARRRKVDEVQVRETLARLDEMPEQPTEEELMAVARQMAAIEQAVLQSSRGVSREA